MFLYKQDGFVLKLPDWPCWKLAQHPKSESFRLFEAEHLASEYHLQHLSSCAFSSSQVMQEAGQLQRDGVQMGAVWSIIPD